VACCATRRAASSPSVGRYVKRLHPATAQATISQLLSHSDGIIRDGVDNGQWQDQLCAQQPRTAHGRTAALVESPGATDLAGDADAHASGDRSRGQWRRSQPQLTRGAEVDAVALPIDIQRHREPAWSPSKIAEAAGAAPKHHQVDPVKWIERAQ
jgi:hypothetical protein